MKVDIIPIGNSKGIRIPKTLLEHCGFGQSVEIDVEDKKIILRSSHQLRQGWDEAFKTMAKRKDDRLLNSPVTAFDDSEWQW